MTNDRTNDAHFAAVAAIYDGDKIFLAQRNDSKAMYPAHYEVPGGHIQIGEDFYQALTREIDEELHVSVEVERIVDAYTFESEGIWKAEVMFLCRLNGGQRIQLNPEDHQSGDWYTREQLADLKIVGLLREPLTKAYEMIGEGNE